MNIHSRISGGCPRPFSRRCSALLAPTVVAFLLCLLPFLAACDGGLEPTEKPVITGTVTYRGGAVAWPPVDSLREVRVVAFRVYPPQDIVSEVLTERAYFTQQSLPLFADTTSYTIELPNPPPDRIAAVVVALRYGDNIMADWRVIGVYTTTGDHSVPSPLDMSSGSAQRAIDITVDFDNLPPQPF